jgi:rRNA-processing protein FCF1
VTEYITDLIRKYRKKGVLLDTNLLLLYLIGSVDPQQVRNFKRTSIFTEDDFIILSNLVDLFETKITTPHILTEVSNFLNSESLFILAAYIKQAEEKFTNSIDLVESDQFVFLGLADTAIVNTAKESVLVLTNDGLLYGSLANNGIEAINFDDIRKAFY